MREKLIELLNDCQAKGFWSYGTDCKTGEHGGHEMTAEDIADYLVENIASKWISVKDRLPEKHGCVYVCLLKFPEAKEAFPYCLTWHAYGDNGYVNGPHFSDEGVSGLKVTHWMPLPEPPKGE